MVLIDSGALSFLINNTTNDAALESHVLGANHYQVELLANLDRVPDASAPVIMSFPKPQHGSGFPARAVAILP
jgi:kynurenine formamidase